MEKVGKIVHVVDAWKPFPAQQYTVTNPGKPRDHESYVVEVKEKGKRRGMERKPKYFWPKVLHLRKSRAKA
jgi:hypothetical protein